MKRDWDLIRKILIDIENDENFLKEIVAAPVKVIPGDPTYERRLADFQEKEKALLGNLELLVQAEYVQGVSVVMSSAGRFAVDSKHARMTMAGHDLLDTMRSSPVWESIKSTAKSKGIELTFDAIKALGKFALKQLAG